MKKRPRLVIRSLAELPPGFVPMSKWLANGNTTHAYSIVRQAVRMGRLSAAKLHPNGRESFRGRVYVHEAEAVALIRTATLELQPAAGPLFATVAKPEPPAETAYRAAETAYRELSDRIAASRTLPELGAVGDSIERHETAGTIGNVEVAALMGQINRRHEQLEPVATVAASLATGDPGTVDRLAASLERVAEALEEILRRGRVELDLEPSA